MDSNFRYRGAKAADFPSKHSFFFFFFFFFFRALRGSSWGGALLKLDTTPDGSALLFSFCALEPLHPRASPGRTRFFGGLRFLSINFFFFFFFFFF